MTKLSRTLSVVSPIEAASLLTRETALSKGRIKDAMQKGAVWWQRAGKPGKRLRRTTQSLFPGDILTLHYDPELLALKPPESVCLLDRQRYSIWCKPAGLLTQGNEFGDHCSLLRQVEQHFTPRRDVFLVHRLDREAMGLVIIAHDKKTAAKLSVSFQNDVIEKRYRVWVRGDLRAAPLGSVKTPLDGKFAHTDYELLEYAASQDVSILLARIHTGRTHQIRRHFESCGHPVIGDPRYGVNNKHAGGMKLLAEYLAFPCPLNNKRVEMDVWKFEGEPVVAACLDKIMPAT